MCEGSGEIPADEVIFDQAVQSRLQGLYRFFVLICLAAAGVKYGVAVM